MPSPPPPPLLERGHKPSRKATISLSSSRAVSQCQVRRSCQARALAALADRLAAACVGDCLILNPAQHAAACRRHKPLELTRLPVKVAKFTRETAASVFSATCPWRAQQQQLPGSSKTSSFSSSSLASGSQLEKSLVSFCARECHCQHN